MILDIFLVHKFLIISINIIGVYLSYAVYSSNSKAKINKIFILMMISMLIWIDFAFLARAIQDQIYLTMFFIKIAWFVTPIFFVLLYFFTIYLIDENYKYRFLNMIVFLIGVIITFLTGLTSLIVSNVEFIGSDLRLIYGTGMFPFLIVILFLICSTLYPLIEKYLRISAKEKNKIEYFLVVIFVFYLANIIFNIILPVFFNVVRLYYFGDYSTIILLIFIAYSITKHDLMGIKTLFTQVLIAIMSIILLVDIIALSTDDFMRLLKIGILITFLYFSRELIKSVKKEKKIAEKLEKANEEIKHYAKTLEDSNQNLEEGNRDLKSLIDGNDAVIGNMDSKKIAQGVVDIIPKSLDHLGYRMGVFILYDREKKQLRTYAITKSRLALKATKALGKAFLAYEDDITDMNNLIARTVKEKKIFSGKKLEDFVSPTVKIDACRKIQELTKARSFVSVPLCSMGNTIGVLLFVGTEEEKDISEKDRNILYMFSSHLGNAIENAELYEQTHRQVKQLAVLNKNLEEANNKLQDLMEIKNEFLHITSHQLRTPLTVIRGMVSMWSEGDFEKLSSKEKNKMIKRILVSTDRLNNITNDMLDAMEMEGGFVKFQLTTMSLKSILDETIELLRPNFEKKGLYLKLKYESEIFDVQAEPNYIRQVFMNVIDNACKYTSKGGVTVVVNNSEKYLETTIQDTGMGISKFDQKRVFGKFTRGSNAEIEDASGSGLGLFIAKKIISNHNGKILISSKGIDKGTVVKISLKIK